MSLTLEPERIVPRVANLSARTGQGTVAYPTQFFDKIARTVPSTPPLPAPTRWFLDRHFVYGVLGVVLLLACVGILAWGLVAPWLTVRW